MPTASTKRRAKKSRERAAQTSNVAGASRSDAGGNDAGAPVSNSSAGEFVSERVWRVASIVVLAVAAFLRFYALERNPLHHDEGVNGWFLTTLVREGTYHYNPENYHGPTLYYFALLPGFLFEKVLGVGMSTFMIRAVPALFGLATVWLVLSLRRRVGRLGALVAAALIAVSPGAVYQSRYFIHETLFVFFTVGIVVAALRYYETAEPSYLLWAFASAALLFATKETAFISVGVLGLAWGVAWGWMWLARKFNWGNAEAWRENGRAASSDAGGQAARGVETSDASDASDRWARFGGAARVLLLLACGVALFLFINVLFYSSFLTYRDGLYGALSTFQIWTKTGSTEHAKSVTTYLTWLQDEEAPIYVLGVLGALWALLRARSRFAVFTGAWAFGLLAAYSLIHYKTPWLALNFTVPMAIAGGYAVNELDSWRVRADDWFARYVVPAAAVLLLFFAAKSVYGTIEDESEQRSFLRLLLFIAIVVALYVAAGVYRQLGGRWREHAPALLVAVGALSVGAYQTAALNFRHYDDDKYPYVYAHTTRQFLQMLGQLERIAKRAGTGEQTPIVIASPDYWPLPWYFRDYKRVEYKTEVQAFQQPIVIGNLTQTPLLATSLAATHVRVGESYELRPGVNLVLYARRELVEP